MPRTACAVLALVLLLIGCDAEGSPERESASATTTPPVRDAIANLPEPAREFLVGDPEHPFGEPGPDMPQETAFFAALAGVWNCAVHVTEGGRRISGWPAVWAFKYSAGGHAIEHLYYQKQADLPPPLVPLRRDSHSVALVQYDPSTQVWRFFSVNNSAGSGIGPSTQVMTGRLDGEVLVFEPDHQDPALLRRERFHDIKSNSFVWSDLESRDQGRTWTGSVSVKCNRIVGP
jgi:hypothetical protein